MIVSVIVLIVSVIVLIVLIVSVIVLNNSLCHSSGFTDRFDRSCDRFGLNLGLACSFRDRFYDRFDRFSDRFDRFCDRSGDRVDRVWLNPARPAA